MTICQSHRTLIGHEIISSPAVLSLHLIQVGQVVSYWRNDGHLVLVNHLGSMPRNSVIKLTDRLDMTIIVDWDVKPQISFLTISYTLDTNSKSADF